MTAPSPDVLRDDLAVDMGKLHRERSAAPAFYRYGRVGEVVIVEAPYLDLAQPGVLDGVAAHQAFRLGGYPDVLDFVTYFVDPKSRLYSAAGTVSRSGTGREASNHYLGAWAMTTTGGRTTGRAG